MQSMEASSQRSTRVIKVTNKMGIHARPAAMIVRIANKYNNTNVWIEMDGEEVNGKSIMGLMMLAAAQGSQLKFVAEGPQADRVLDELVNLFKRKFEEG